MRRTRVYLFLCLGLARHFFSCDLVAIISKGRQYEGDMRFDCQRLGPNSPCGEGWCRCFDEGLANCSGLASQGESLRFVPKLPRDIRTLCFGNDNITTIDTADFFANVTNVQALYLGFDSLTYLHPDAFRPLTNLTTLSIEGNALLHQSDLSVVFAIPTLQQLDLRLCELGPVPDPIFSNVSAPRLRVLFLGENRFEAVDISAFTSLTALEKLNLDSNRILRVDIHGVSEVRELDLSKNSIYDFPETCNGNGVSFFPELKTLDLSYNNIASMPHKVCLPNLKTLKLGRNNFDTLETDTFNGDGFPVLRELMLDSMTPGLILHDGALRGLRHLESVNLSDDDLIVFGMVLWAFVDCPCVTDLKLNANIFFSFDGSASSRAKKVAGYLRPSDHTSNDDRQPQRPLESVEQLGLTRSSLEDRFDLAQLVAYFPRLTHLFLSQNHLTHLPDGLFDNLRHLKHVDLSQNLIQVVSERTFSAAMRHRLAYLSLQNNPFRCSCDLQWFLAWVRSAPSFFFPPVNYNCEDVPGRELHDFVLAPQSCLLGHGVYVSMVYVTSLSLLLLVVVVVVFRYRWHLRLVLYEVFRGSGDVRRRHLEVGDFDYDVFVSHDEDDEPWVRQHLMPQLEDRLGLRLCLHQRDFIPGKDIVSNIVTSVQSSKKVMMIFSPSFAKSPWCQFELTFCLQHVMDLDDALIILCLGDVASRDLTAAMMAVLKTTTCLQWMGEEGGEEAVRSFWGRVQIALKEVIPRENV